MVKNMRIVHKKTKMVADVIEVKDQYYFELTTEDEIGSLYSEAVYWNREDCVPLIEQITSLDEYQKLAARTLPDLTEFYPDIEGQSSANHLHMWFGIDSEIGEIIDLYKKSFAYRRKFDKVNLLEEVCDIMWYLAGEATLEVENLSDFINDIIYTGSCVPDGEYPTIITMDEVIGASRNYTVGQINTEDFIGFFISSEEELFRGLTNNINKLIIRYPEKFNNTDALNRSLDVERNELEK